MNAAIRAIAPSITVPITPWLMAFWIGLTDCSLDMMSPTWRFSK
jgi:hypothetical protein